MKTIIFLLFISLPILSLSQASKWHGTNQNGQYPDINLLNSWENDTLEIITTYSGIGDGYSSPSINDLGLFVAGMHEDSIGYIYRYDINGEEVWERIYL